MSPIKNTNILVQLYLQSAWFGRDDQALRGFSKFFHKASEEEHEHAEKLIDYMNKRGGVLELHQIRVRD